MLLSSEEPLEFLPGMQLRCTFSRAFLRTRSVQDGAQPGSSPEIIVVDGGSTDATVSEARQAGAQVGHCQHRRTPTLSPPACDRVRATHGQRPASLTPPLKAGCYRGTET